MPTRWQVERAVLAAKMESQAKVIVLALCVKSVAATAVVPPEHTPSLVELADMAGLAKSTVAEWLKVLDAAGWVRRERPAEGSKYERTSYALDVGAASVSPPSRAARKSRKAAASSPPGGPLDTDVPAPAETPEISVSSPPSGQLAPVQRSARRYASGPPGGTPAVRPADFSGPPGGPPPSYDLSKTKTNHAGPAETTNPTTEPATPEPGAVATVAVVALDDIADTSSHPTDMINEPRPSKYPPNTPTRMPANPPRSSRQAGLFSTKNFALPERAQIVYDWLRWNGYPEATEDDARQIDAMLKRDMPGKHASYLRGVAGPNGSGFAVWYERIRAERAERAEAEIRELERTKPRCEHGTLAGREPHPTHGTPLCPACRRSLPARKVEATTHPVTATALAAYTSAYPDQLTAADVVMLAQQFEALRVQGATEGQLVQLATVAAAANVAPLVAATRKDA
jgi:hypothetical protein